MSVEGGEPVVIANGAEGEPGSIKDRFVMLTRPERVVEGLGRARDALGAREAIVYLKGSYAGPAAALESALRKSPLDGLRVRVVRGEDGYIAGEETALIESLEGRPAWPRAKPPLPAAVGLHGRPTLVQNVETLSRVGAALADPEAFRATEATFVSVWGDVTRPGVHEVRLGTPLRAIIEERAGGATDGVALLFPAGPSAPPLLAEQADTPLDPDAVRAAGSALGTASLLVVGRSACPLAVALSLAAFFERESCGQCPPCTLGTASLARIARAAVAGTAHGSETSQLGEVAGFMSVHGYCAHSRTAAAAVSGLLARVRGHTEAHRGADRCPDGLRATDPFHPASPERTAIEAVLTPLQPGGEARSTP